MSDIDYLGHLETDGAALVAAISSAPEAEVAGCGGWTNRALAAHVGGVYAMANHLVQCRATEFSGAGEAGQPPDRSQVIPWLVERHRHLMDTLRAVDPETPVWSWSDRHDAGFYRRRMAQETLVHRWDAQQAAHQAGIGEPPAPLDPQLANDGIDEYLEVGLRSSSSQPDRSYPTGSLHLHRTDGEGEWMLVADADGTVTVTTEHGKGDAAVRGTAEALLLFVWNRGRHDIEVFGDEAIADAWAALAP